MSSNDRLKAALHAGRAAASMSDAELSALLRKAKTVEANEGPSAAVQTIISATRK